MNRLILKRNLLKFNTSQRAFVSNDVAIKQLDNLQDQSKANTIINHVNHIAQDPKHSRLFAVVMIGGSQFKVTTEDVIVVRNAFHPTIGDKIRLEKVLLVGGKDFTIVGKPLLNKEFVRVDATVIEKTLSQDVIIFTYTPRKDNRKWNFSKSLLTLLRINNIDILGPVPENGE